ncbi:autotransporter domain-containing protein [Bosea sp. BH3]|uniref:autotransporter outer membrane beta-barrel domain-containing protein n=1 Tax=Bosea sp. BH3 TaxID=2871701 RepID=UPI0021CB5C0D|nr:autotransporter domain-containing protein [Bosea sp. BH3]MCU4180575.1 autotransporter domain-containing protein [Bosea sp. BH3]
MLASTALALASMPLATGPAQAQTWLANPGSSNYYDGGNWSSGSVPAGTASFGASNTTALTLGLPGTISGWTFSAGASNYTFDIQQLTSFSGFGITINGGSATINNDNDMYFTNASSAGSAAIINTNTMNFSNTSSADRATITNNSTMIFHDGSSASSSVINNTSGLSFTSNSTAGSATITNSTVGSAISFSDSSTAGSATITSSGSIFFSDSSTAGSATFNSDGYIAFSATATAGNAAITNVTGTVEFRDSSTAGNAAITNITGTVEFRNSSTAGSATIINNDRIIFRNTTTAGNATLINNAGGTVDFSFSTGPNGDSRLSAASIAGAGNYLLGANELTVGSNDRSTEVSGIISGAGGSLVKLGTGTLTLSGANTYSGATTVSGGRLAVNGSLAGSVIVNAGGELGGTGTVGGALINGGMLAPGNSIGVLNVAGNLAFTSASTYAVEVSPSSADRVNVSGTATLGGATVAASFAAGSYVAKQYTILNAAGGVSGTFGTKVDTNLPAGFKSVLSYDANNAYLDLELLPASLNRNQSRVSHALTKYFDAAGSIPMAFGTLTPAGLSQASGEPATGAQTATHDAMTQFMGTLVDPSPEGRGIALGAAPTGFASYSSASGKGSDLPTRKVALTADPDLWRWSVWGSGFGGAQFTGAHASAGTAANTNRVYGAAVGADYKLTPSTIAGFAFAGGATSFNTYGLGSGKSDLFQAGLFLRQHFGQAYLSAGLAYGWQDVTTDRSVLGERLEAKFDVNSWSGKLEAGHRFALGPAALTPYVAAQFTAIALPDYAERALAGPSLFALSYASRDVTTTRSELGLRADANVSIGGLPLSLRGGVAWVHNFETATGALASFQSLPGATFLVSGAALDRNALRTTATAELDLKNGLSIAATFDGEFGENSRSLGGKGALRYRW